MDAAALDNENLKSLTLLYVEDDEDCREEFSELLSRSVGKLITATNGLEGIEAFNRHHPDIILADISMPVMDGLAMAEKIREADKSVPIIVLTAFEQNDYLMKSINIGIDRYLTKPVDIHKLQETLLTFARRLAAEKQLKKSLLASEEKYRALVECANEIISVIQDGKACMVNPAAINMTGYSEQELTTTPFLAFVHPDDQAMVLERHKARLEGANSPGRYEFRMLAKDGGTIWVINNAVKIEWEGRPATLNVLTDINEQKNLEETLRDREAKFRLLTENTSDNIWTMNLDGRMTFVSQSISRIRGYSAEEAITQSFDEVIAPNSLATAYAKLGEIITNVRLGLPVEKVLLELELLCKDGSTVWTEIIINGMYDNDGAFVQLLGVTRDISKRIRREFELLKLSRAVEQSPVSIVITDVGGYIEFINPKFSELTGYTAEEAIGRNSRMLNSGNTPKSTYKDLWKTITSGNVWKGEFHNKSKDGSLFWEHATISPLRDAAGDITHFIAVKENITEKKIIMEQLVYAKEQAEAATQVKGDFLATMSHEIRTPMNGVIGMTGLLLDTELDEKQRYYAETVSRSGDHLLTLINDILDFSKIESGKMDLELLDFDLLQTLEETTLMFAHRAEDAGLKLACRMEPDVPQYLKGDPGRVRQILTNLVGNALKFTSHGSVSVNASLAEEQDDCATVRFEINDTGIGIPESRLTAIFEPFTQANGTTTRKYGGTGLGLAICKQLAELMGGEIGVTSEMGKGSTFWFTVRFEKCSESELEQLVLLSEQQTAVVNSSADRTARILLAEDNIINLKVAQGILNQLGFKCDVVANGEEAVQALEMIDYDLVLMDCQMPVMDGFEASAIIRSPDSVVSNRDVPIIAMTANAMKGDREKCLAAGMNDYLSKPVKKSELAEMLDRWLAGVQPREEPTDDEIIHYLLSKQQAAVVSPEVSRNARILLAEDNIINQKVAQGILNQLGFKCDVVANGEEAVQALETTGYDLVLMDCQMPEMDGFEATVMIRSQDSKVSNHEVPIIAMTANAMKWDREKCLAAGMNDYLAKPVRNAELAVMLDRWLAGVQPREEPMDDVIATVESLSLVDVEDILARIGGDQNFIMQLLDLSSTQLPLLLKKLLVTMFVSYDMKSLCMQAHTLKGAALNISALALSDVCLRVETAANDGDMKTVQALLPELEKTVEMTVEAIGKIRPDSF